MTHKAKVSIEFASDEMGSTFECKVDTGPFKPCNSPTKVRAGKGKHRVLVRATDRAGNVDLTPASDVYKVVR